MVCAQLTELKALLGCVGQVKFVMGCISQLTDGRYFLEDMSDSLPIDLSDAQTTSGFFTGDFQRPVPLPMLHKSLRSDSDAGSPAACTHCLREAAHPGAEGAVWRCSAREPHLGLGSVWCFRLQICPQCWRSWLDLTGV